MDNKKRNRLRIWISFVFPTFLILRWGIQYFSSKFPGHGIDLVGNILTVIFTILIFSCPVIVILLSKYDYQYADYLESEDTTKPNFRVSCSSVIDIPNGVEFNRLKNEIANKWWITFSDDVVLKFRIRWHPFKPKVTAAWLKFDAETGKIQLECFPIQGKQHDYLAEKMQKEIEQCINSHMTS